MPGVSEAFIGPGPGFLREVIIRSRRTGAGAVGTGGAGCDPVLGVGAFSGDERGGVGLTSCCGGGGEVFAGAAVATFVGAAGAVAVDATAAVSGSSIFCLYWELTRSGTECGVRLHVGSC